MQWRSRAPSFLVRFTRPIEFPHLISQFYFSALPIEFLRPIAQLKFIKVQANEHNRNAHMLGKMNEETWKITLTFQQKVA